MANHTSPRGLFAIVLVAVTLYPLASLFALSSVIVTQVAAVGTEQVAQGERAGAGPVIVDNINWAAYLQRHDPIWRWNTTCTTGYTVHPETIRYDGGASGCATHNCTSAAKCVEESAAMCDRCSSCASFGLSPMWRDGLFPQLYASDSASGFVHNEPWTTYSKGGPALTNHSSCQSAGPAGLATVWEDAAFYGNGLVGGLVLLDARDPLHTLRLQLGRTDVADHRNAGSPYATGSLMFDKPRLPVGSLGLTTVGTMVAGEFRVHLHEGTITGQLSTTQGAISFTLLAHYTQIAVILQWNASGAEAPNPTTGEGGASLVFVPLPGNSTRHSAPPSYKNNPPPSCTGSAWGGDVQVCTQALLVGSNYATAWATRPWGPERETTSTEASVNLLTILHIANDYPQATSPQTAHDLVALLHAKAAGQQGAGLYDLLQEHNNWWAGFWPDSFLSIPDTVTEAMSVMQQYKYASAARKDGPAIDLMGPWWQTSGWELYWWDMNVPVTYWATYAARRFDIAGTLSFWLEAHLATMMKNVAVPPGKPNITDGMGFGSITSFDMEATMTITPNSQLGNPTWIAHNLYMHAAFTANTTMLRELVFPFLRGTVNTYLAFCVNGSDGLIHLPPTASPEYPYPHGPAKDTNYDMALFKWGALTLLQLASQLDIHDPLIPRWRDVVNRLAPFPTNEHGYMVDSVNGFNIPHRHFSHLFSIYPLHLTNWDDVDGGSPETRELITKSVNRWTGLTCTGGPGKDLCPNGFTFDGAASMSALFPKGGTAAAGNISGFIVSGQMHASTLYSEGRQPCFESPPGAANSLQEILLQSWGGRVRVFPAVPDSWPDAVIHRLGAEGGLAVSAVRSQGKLSWVGIEAIDYTGDVRKGTANAVRSVILVAAGLGPAAQVSTEPAGIKVVDAPGNALAFNITVGDLIVLYPAAARPTQFAVAELPGNPADFNYWGKHPTGNSSLQSVQFPAAFRFEQGP